MLLSLKKLLPSLILGLMGGLLMGLTVAPTNLWLFAWVALIPLWIAVSQSLSTSVITAFLWGCSYHGVALFWIIGIHPMTWMGVPWWNSLFIALFCWLLITLWGAILVTIWAYLYKLFIPVQISKKSYWNYPSFKILLAITLWCLLEQIWSFTPLWWTSISFTQSPYNLSILQLLNVSGTTTITALILLINFCLGEAIIHLLKDKNRVVFFRWCGITSIFFFASHILGFSLYQSEIINDPSQQIKIGLIQGNIPNEVKLYDVGLKTAIDNYSKGYQDLAQENVDLIVTPETALPFFYEQIKNNTSFYPLIKQEQIPIILGAFNLLDRQRYKNSLFMINSQGNVMSRYDKIKLVPLGEYIPFQDILGNFISRLSPLDTYLIHGEKNQILNSPWGKIIAAICYDSAFSEVFRQQALAGGEFIVTASNDAHYSESMPAQHHAQDVMRAIETNRWMVRATNTGYSAIVDPHGNTIWLSDINQYQTHQDIIYRRHNLTFYVKQGDWLIKLLVILSFFLISINYISTK
jgi:apolipoprotein N-acyltransferase